MRKKHDMPPKSFSKYTLKDRLLHISEKTGLKEADISSCLMAPSQDIVLAETLIESPIGYFSLPLGIVKSLIVNNTQYCVPMAVEETSVVAAMNKIASWVSKSGSLSAWTEGKEIIGQIQISKLNDPTGFKKKTSSLKEQWVELANKGPAASLFRRGGGVIDIKERLIPRQKDSGIMGVLHVYLDPCEAMGANQVNQVCEFLKPHIESQTGEKVGLCILSNLSDTKLIKAKLTIKNIDSDLGYKIEEASHFAECDPYRAVTHNKGIMNGIDAVLIATGNDWRAVEAGLHGYAATQNSTSYSPLSIWRMEGKDLVGTFKGPLTLGTVGGATKLHPTAQLALKCLGNPSANEMAQVIACVGLAQNLGALRALVTEGIIKGHMSLHIKNILHGLEATAEQKSLAQTYLEEKLRTQSYISESDAKAALKIPT